MLVSTPDSIFNKSATKQNSTIRSRLGKNNEKIEYSINSTKHNISKSR